MGLPVIWRLAAGPGGAFAERLAGDDLAFSWGHPGRPGAPCWEVDAAGVAKALELDDHESLLLAAWVRTGWWLAPGASEALCLSLEAIEAAGGADGSAPPPSRRRTAAAPTPPPPPVIGVRLAGGALVARVTLDPATWLPASMAQPLCGAAEVWSYTGWSPWAGAGGLLYPGTTTHAASAGGDNRFVTRRGEMVAGATRREAAGAARGVPGPATTARAAAWAAEFVPPPTDALSPPGSSFDAGALRDVPAWWTPSGHLLVRPKLAPPLPANAPPGTPPPPPVDAGLFLVDTGASGLVLDAAAADALNLPAFGELHVSGMVGPVRARLRRGGALVLGPLTLARPLFMEMSVAGLVRGAPGPVVGIIGYDVFRAAVVTLPRPATRPRGGRKGPGGGGGGGGGAEAAAAGLPPSRLPRGTTATSVRLDDPVTYAPPKAASGRWQPLVMVANLPHVRAPFAPGPGAAAAASAAAGAGGADAAAAAPLLAPHPVLGEATNLPLSAAGGGGGGRAAAAVAAAGALAPCPRSDPPPPDPPGLGSRAALFMIDSGAGGVDVMFHRRAAAALGLLPRGVDGAGASSPPSPRVVRGLGGGAASAGAAAGPAAPAPSSPPPASASAVGVTPGDLAWLALGGRPYTPVRALVAGAGGLDLSLYTAGVICADLLSRSTVIVDYPRRRAAFLPPPGRPPSLGGSGDVRGAEAVKQPRPRARRARALRQEGGGGGVPAA